jgi:hypothetical protein
MRAEGRFTVASFDPVAVEPAFAVATATAVGMSTIAMESFEGSVSGTTGTFNFAHTATTTGTDRTNDLLVIVPSSGTGALAGISGASGMAIDADGTHRIWFDYDLA